MFKIKNANLTPKNIYDTKTGESFALNSNKAKRFGKKYLLSMLGNRFVPVKQNVNLEDIQKKYKTKGSQPRKIYQSVKSGERDLIEWSQQTGQIKAEIKKKRIPSKFKRLEKVIKNMNNFEGRYNNNYIYALKKVNSATASKYNNNLKMWLTNNKKLRDPVSFNNLNLNNAYIIKPNFNINRKNVYSYNTLNKLGKNVTARPPVYNREYFTYTRNQIQNIINNPFTSNTLRNHYRNILARRPNDRNFRFFRNHILRRAVTEKKWTSPTTRVNFKFPNNISKLSNVLSNKKLQRLKTFLNQ